MSLFQCVHYENRLSLSQQVVMTFAAATAELGEKGFAMATGPKKGSSGAPDLRSDGITYLASEALRKVAFPVGTLDGAKQHLRDAALSNHHNAVPEAITRLIGLGMSEARVQTELVPELLAELGEDWAHDRMHWSTVSAASTKLQSYIRGSTHLGRRSSGDAGRILIAVPVGEDHTISAAILQKRIAAIGHYAALSMQKTPAQMAEEFHLPGFDLIAISVHRPESMPQTLDLLDTLGDSAPKVPVVLGGGIVSFDVPAPDQVALVTNDLNEALSCADLFLEQASA
ncbi:MAG: hypothetical protein AAF826_09960, partial [Pseudomonadota bacterium]